MLSCFTSMDLFSLFLSIILLMLTPLSVSQLEEFVSIDCGGKSNYTDGSTGLSWISDSDKMHHGTPVEVEDAPNGGTMVQYRTRRDFPIDSKKQCYTLSTVERRRYLVRATFQYGMLKNGGTYPQFQLYLDATKWATISIYDAKRVYIEEMIIRAPTNSIDVCMCCATTGSPFISTLELRPLNLSMYATDYEDNYYLKVAARINFGAPSEASLRYPDDPYDRIWDSDLARRQNFLVGVAPGTERISTTRNIDIGTREYPPVRVMQTAVVGTKGVLSYRLNLEDFPANARAYAYFAEIEDLGKNEVRKFKLKQPYIPDYSNAVVNIAENVNGSYILYEPSYMNVSLDFVLSFNFVATPDSTRGPLLNAMEISKYVRIASKTDRQDSTVVNALRSASAESLQMNEGDPCVPTPWEWINCSATTPPRISKIVLSRRNLTGEIPPELNNMDALTELWLDGNSLTGTLPDMSNLINLKIVFIQNNSFSGEIPARLISGKFVFNYDGNIGLHRGSKKHFKLILGISIGVLAILLLLFIGTLLLLLQRRKSQTRQKGVSAHKSTKPSTAYSLVRGNLTDEGTTCYIALSDLKEATDDFSKKIGKGSFGSVYYGRMKDGKEVAVKTMTDSSSHGNRQFVNEVALLSRIHHRNLVPLIGYCEEEYQHILVYEYMHNGTLRDHLHEPSKQKNLDWLSRLRIAEDAAKGLEYLHRGCNPSIIHRDVKTSNILLDINMRAKVSDFGLSRLAEEDLTHISSIARGTIGYLDPEYYANQQLTEKSDVYSFGVVLLELISGRKPVSPEDYGDDMNIVHWARPLIRKGDVMRMIDPCIAGNAKIESIWRVVEIAMQCVQQHGASRPRMQEVILAIQDATKIEIEAQNKLKSTSSSSTSGKPQSSRKTLLTSFLEIESPDSSSGCIPSAR
ncbi:probable LRR receptor-like serine/threonine-protein kinase At1g67720 isoform X4 [Arachis ipaensis]|uniref:probable LRR receptor-like serine/threonine-protein kinase At1g67720 isoform X4 n=1 Tax=Arachis ipaensis TaxID=130454 RepID=UPI000A2B1BF7|nr:probable LRR receptor-like serine/threonine-protein kinase At1g67720 isoform X4 [Arachis ipaensis]